MQRHPEATLYAYISTLKVSWDTRLAGAWWGLSKPEPLHLQPCDGCRARSWKDWYPLDIDGSSNRGVCLRERKDIKHGDSRRLVVSPGNGYCSTCVLCSPQELSCDNLFEL